MKFGDEKGQICNRDGCKGIIDEEEKGSCSCHICPPCSACTTPLEVCRECGWTARDEENQNIPKMTESDKKFLASLREIQDRPLDPTRIDWKSYGRSNSSMTKKGVYPEGTAKAEVEKVVRGSFGGRFLSFGDGKFEYVAYTD